MTPIPEIHGYAAPGFEAVHDAFAQNVGEIGDGGAAFAVMAGGELVVDLWAGQAGERSCERDTRCVLMSATKGIAATVVALLAERGLINVAAPVATYWPEFAAGGKAGVTVEHVLTHSAGLVTVPGYQEFLRPDGTGWDDTARILRSLETAEPEWTPGTGHAYHGLTIGWLLGEIVRRVAGVSVGAIVREEIAGPLALELDLGTPSERFHLVAPVILPAAMPVGLAGLQEQLADPSSMAARLYLAVDGQTVLNCVDRFLGRPETLAMELPAVNGTGTARALATHYAALVGAGPAQLLSPETVAAFSTERRRAPDLGSGMESRWGLGYSRPVRPVPGLPREWGPRDETFGHNGYGGQVAFADPVNHLGFGFIRNHLSWTSPLAGRLVDTVYDCLPG